LPKAIRKDGLKIVAKFSGKASGKDKGLDDDVEYSAEKVLFFSLHHLLEIPSLKYSFFFQ